MNIAERAGLIILDGWGLGPDPAVDAIAQAVTPTFDLLWANYPHATLVTHGEAVGLPPGQMGNSEVGHLNIGAGRIVWQELARINKAIFDGSLASNTGLQETFAFARREDKALHLMGLVSDGGVHSHIDHLLALCSMASAAGLHRVYIHAFLDGRDTGPHSGLGFIKRLEAHLAHTPGVQLASMIGRYYAMDRDHRWERIRRCYDLLVYGKGDRAISAEEALRASYAKGITDEFLEPTVLVHASGEPRGLMADGDALLFFNFRTDRPRQLVSALTQQAFPEHQMFPLHLHTVTMGRYDDTFRNIRVLFEKDHLEGTLGEVLSQHGKTQWRLAETEKYPHVTYFFSGGREVPFPGEERLVIPSPKVATYDLQPEMSAVEVTDALLSVVETSKPDFFCVNYANTDMVGHTGVFDAAKKAAETVDQCLALLLPVALEEGYHLIIIADHGNADCMVQPDGTPHTAHTMNPVPIIYVAPGPPRFILREGKLADVAPTLLYLLGLPPSSNMDGEVLLQPSAL